MLKHIGFFLVGLFACAITSPFAVFGAPVQGVLERPALEVSRTGRCRCVMTDADFAGSRLVAVGERGVIIYSDDSGDTWRQAEVPVSVTLTAVSFPSPLVGYAVGHGGVVIHTVDGGLTWERQLEGVTVARMALENAQARAEAAGPDDFDAQQMVNNALLLVEDGPDKPFLDLYFENEREGFIVGSYGLFFRTEDGGDTWECRMDRVENPDGLNLYGIDVADGAIYLAGEQGLFLVSEDDGNSFHRVETPYYGTFFDVQSMPGGEFVLVGLRGNAYWSSDQGQTFSKSDVSVEVSFTDVALMPNGNLLFANQAGVLQESRDRGRTIRPVQVQQLDPVSSILPMGDNMVMTVGLGGAVRVQLPSSDSTDKGGQP